LISDAGFSGIELDLSLDEEGIRDMFKNAIPDTDDVDKYATKINGLVDAYQKWQELQREIIKSDVQVFARLMGGGQSYEDQLHNINEEVREQIGANLRLANLYKETEGKKGISPEQEAEANRRAIAQGDYKKLQLSANYINAMNNAVAMTSDKFEEVKKSIDATLESMLRHGDISKEQYVTEKQRLDTAEQSRIGAPGSAFEAQLRGGFEGRASYYRSLQSMYLNQMGASEYSEDADSAYQTNKRNAEAAKILADEAQKMAVALERVQNAANKLISAMNYSKEFFNAIGDKDTGSGLEKAGTMLSSLYNGVSTGAQIGGVWGGIIGGALGMVVGAFQVQHLDAQETHQRNKLLIDKLNNINKNLDKIAERSLGYASMDDQTKSYFAAEIASHKEGRERLKELKDVDTSNMTEEELRKYESEVAFSQAKANKYSEHTIKAMEEAEESGSAYMAQYASLLAQRDRAASDLRTEEGDKDGSKEQIESYKQQIAELDDQIIHFGQDLAKNLWGIDIKGWADQINDALMNAFENGENAAKAYEDTVRSIMQSVTSQMMKIGILQPMMDQLQKQLFGTQNDKGEYVGGTVSSKELLNDPEGSAKKLVEKSKDFFDEQGNLMITAAREFYEGMNAMMGGSLRNPDTKTLSASVQGTSEQTSGLLAGYVATTMQDVAMQRTMLEHYLNEMWPTYIDDYVKSMTNNISLIQSNVKDIRDAIVEPGGMADMIYEIHSIFDAVSNGSRIKSISTE